MVKCIKGKRISIKTIDNQKINGKCLRIEEAYWGKKRKPEKTIVIEKRDSIIAIPFRNLLTKIEL